MKTYVLHSFIVHMMVCRALVCKENNCGLAEKSGLQARDLHLCSDPCHINVRDAPGLRSYSSL